MKFNPVSGRENFTTVKDPAFLKLQIEEMHATEHDGFAPDVQAELDKLFWCDVMIWQFPLWWFGAPAILKGWADRVLAMGKTCGGDRFYENGQFKGETRAVLGHHRRPGSRLRTRRLQRRHPQHPVPNPARHPALRRL